MVLSISAVKMAALLALTTNACLESNRWLRMSNLDEPIRTPSRTPELVLPTLHADQVHIWQSISKSQLYDISRVLGSTIEHNLKQNAQLSKTQESD